MMSGTELQPLSLSRYPLVLLPAGMIGALGAMAAMATTRLVRGRPLALVALGVGAAAVAGAAMFFGRNEGLDAGPRVVGKRPTARDLFPREPRRDANATLEKAERLARRPDRFPTISPPPKPGATRPS